MTRKQKPINSSAVRDHKRRTVIERILASRGYQENISLVNWFVGGPFDKSLIWVLIDTLIMWCLILLYARLLLVISPNLICLFQCQKGSELCCDNQPIVLLQLLSLALPVMSASYLSSKLTKNNRFRYSTWLSSLLLVSSACVLTFLGIDLVVVILLLLVLFFANFFGYRLAFWL